MLIFAEIDLFKVALYLLKLSEGIRLLKLLKLIIKMQPTLIEILRDYFDRILDSHKAMKVLILDSDTKSTVSMVISQT